MFNQIYKLLGLNKDSSLAQYLVKGTSLSFILLIYNVGLTFLNSIVLARLGGGAAYGRYVYIMTCVNIFCVFALFGFQTLSVRELPKLKTNNNFEGVKHFFQHTFWWVLSGSLLVAILGWLFLSSTGKIGGHNSLAFKLAIVILPFWSLSLLLSGMLRGAKHIIHSQLPLKVFRPSIFILVVLIQAYFIGAINAHNMVFGQLVALAIVFASYVFFLRKDEGWILEKPKRIFYNNNWTKVALLFFFQGIIISFNLGFDILVLENYRSDEEIGYYSIAKKISSLLSIVLLTVNLVIAPEIAKLYEDGNNKKLELLIRKSIRVTFFLSLPIGLFLIAAGPFILGLYGKDFGTCYPVLIIFVFVQLINVGVGSVGNILNMTGHEKEVLYGIVVSLVFNVVLNLIFVPLYGMLGAAAATGLSVIIWNILLWIFVKRKIGINASVINFKGKQYGRRK